MTDSSAATGRRPGTRWRVVRDLPWLIVFAVLRLASMQLTFRTAPGGPVVATAGADYVGCQFAWVTADARTIWLLDENTSSGHPVQQQILAIAGIRWPYPPG